MQGSIAPWTPAQHEPLVRLTDNLWVVDGELPGVPIGRRMCVVKLSTGQLVIHSGIAVDEATCAELERWGEPAFVLVTNQYHHIDAPAFKRRYPKARVLCSPHGTKRASRFVSIDGVYDQLPPDPVLRTEYLAGTDEYEAALIVTTGDQVSLVFTDLFQNLPDRLPGAMGLMLKVMGHTGGPRVPWFARVMLARARSAPRKRQLADHLRALAAVEGLRRIVPGHGAIIESSPAQVLARAADRVARART